ncbi:IS110 family transposase [Sphingopyxis sp.]|uniref:IS110 family transposase n=1 Tax=Sphingopyxis sp. TaxID=1908224 RepID=UPI002D78EC87|nr:IS110 family transposase [Sphingopyxis sp.]HET6525107.1 IS110 family transposase [Sphingopyxis sp.]
MEKIATIGLDIAKSVFQVHGVDAAGEVVVRKRLSRARVIPFFAKLPRCLVGIEACSNSHHWARELIALGHDVRLMLNRQRTQLSNATRAHMSEFGIVAPVGRIGLERLLAIVADKDDESIPPDARLCLEMLGAQLAIVKEQILENDRRIRASARDTEVGRRLMEIPGVGPLLASAFVASVADPGIFKTGRDLAAWIGLVPRQNSSGGKERLGGISRAGNQYLRQMLVVGSMAVIRHAERYDTKRPWLIELMKRRAKKVAAVALANKTARMVWALMTSGEHYREPQVAHA